MPGSLVLQGRVVRVEWENLADPAPSVIDWLLNAQSIAKVFCGTKQTSWDHESKFGSLFTTHVAF